MLGPSQSGWSGSWRRDGARRHVGPGSGRAAARGVPPQQRQQRRAAPRASGDGGLGGGVDGDPLASEFASLVNRLGVPPTAAAPARPSHLMAPTAVVAAQLEALQRPDWPDAGAGVAAAFRFSMPLGHGGGAAPRSDPRQGGSGGGGSGAGGGAPSPNAAAAAAAAAAPAFPTAAVPESAPRRSWAAHEDWLSLAEFKSLVEAPPYDVLLACDSWRLASPLRFPSSRHGARAVQAVEVVAARRAPMADEQQQQHPQQRQQQQQHPQQRQQQQQRQEEAQQEGQRRGQHAAPESSGGDSNGVSSGGSGGDRVYRFTWCLERVEAGSLKGCWLTVGVRVGDYTL